MVTKKEKEKRGRPRSEAAASHEDILDAVYDLLHEKSIYDLTIEEIARRAKVGKPTIYKWWPNKAALVMDMFEQRLVGTLTNVDAKTAEGAIRAQVTELIRLLNGFFGKVSADIIAEGQCDPGVMKEYRDRYQTHRRAFSREVIQRARATGEFKRDVDPEVLIDMIYGPIYYRRLVRHARLDKRFGDELVDHVMAYVKS